MPDWRNPDDYKYLDNYNALYQWAWEFLRRNPDYRNAYSEWEVAAAELEVMPEALSDPRYAAVVFYTGMLYDAATKPWWLGYPANPNDPAHKAELHFRQFGGVSVVDIFIPPIKMMKAPVWSGYPQHAVLKFDLGYSVDTLLHNAESALRYYQRRAVAEGGVSVLPTPDPRKFRKDRFSLYVRCLDAKLADISTRQLAKELFSEQGDPERSARYALETALTLSQDGYRELLLSPHI